MNGTGELLHGFSDVCTTRVWRDPAGILDARLDRRLISLGSSLGFDHRNWLLAGNHYDLVYINS
jgi:hypothetical protein